MINNKGKKAVAEKRIITTGLSYGNSTIVITGLKGDEQFIDKGARSIQDEEFVEIMSEKN